MQTFIYTVQIPNNNVQERQVKSVQEGRDSVSKFNVKELDRYFSGEFGWKLISDTHGVYALQYVNPSLVRLIIKMPNRTMADEVVRSFGWHLLAKKEHKRPYARRCSGTRLMTDANAIASNSALSKIG